MNRSAWGVVVGAIALLATATASAQVNYQPTRAPMVTAEAEAWYLAGEPVMYAGILFYPAGPQVHFNPNEMVRSGFFHAIPLYTRTTIEPYSIVFVPLRGGLMQPYERRRSGDVAGTVGSSMPSFPVVRSSEPSGESMPQAAAPPAFFETSAADRSAAPAAGVIVPPAEPAPAIGSTGRIYPAPRTAAPPARAPQGANALFIDFGGRRWFSEGPATPLTRTQAVRIGEHHGFAVYAAPGGDPAEIFLPVSKDADDFVARYVRRPAR